MSLASHSWDVFRVITPPQLQRVGTNGEIASEYAKPGRNKWFCQDVS
jgi:hypothetical protein